MSRRCEPHHRPRGIAFGTDVGGPVRIDGRECHEAGRGGEGGGLAGGLGAWTRLPEGGTDQRLRALRNATGEVHCGLASQNRTRYDKSVCDRVDPVWTSNIKKKKT